MRVAAIIAGGGAGRRLGSDVPKQLLTLGGIPMLQRAVEIFRAHPRIDDVVVAVPPALAQHPPVWLRGVRVVAGGESRQASVANAFDQVPDAADIVLVHDAARPFVTHEVISRTIDAAAADGAAIAALPVSDTVKRAGAPDMDFVAETIPREQIFLAQTPQGFRRQVLADAVALGRSGVAGTDEAALAERAGHRVRLVAGESANVKITTPADFDDARTRVAPRSAAAARVGVGYDLHRLVPGRRLVLAGVAVPFERGALGHSDADVVCHAVTDAILGAARAGDIGRLFPDTEPRWQDASSIDLLRQAVAIVRDAGWTVDNVDVVVILERPKLAPYRDEMERSVAEALGIAADAVSIKGKTNEGMDAVGRSEAIAAHAVAMLRKIS